ncbi:Hypothetical predicted protein [Pelobates cultripes]|uniref:C-type lectin domain-containing protein n=1 Tax=Pelobates cultripes TaxID=61616 RepID=A0AAD1RJG5_PELCU|nr:Hypothetical predicted protein [Pelobates cultripes]
MSENEYQNAKSLHLNTVTDHKLKQMNQKLEFMFINMNVSVNAQMEFISQEGRLQHDNLKSTLERISGWAFKQLVKSLDPICEQGWSYSHLSCYRYFKDNKSFNNSKTFCESKNSHLVVINSAAEKEYIVEFTGNEINWIGLSKENGDWKWVDGTRYDLNQTYWVPGQPDNGRDQKTGEVESCATFRQNGLWNDALCSNHCPFVCEKDILYR